MDGEDQSDSSEVLIRTSHTAEEVDGRKIRRDKSKIPSSSSGPGQIQVAGAGPDPGPRGFNSSQRLS